MSGNPNVKPSDRAVLLAVVTPQSASTAKSSGWVNAGLFAGFLADILLGDAASGATFDAKLEQATDSDGTGVKAITGKAITQVDDTNGDVDNKQYRINCQAEDLDLANSFNWIRLTITPATAACLLAGVLYGFDARYGPAADATSVAEVIG
jgi:hypothetical protein